MKSGGAHVEREGDIGENMGGRGIRKTDRQTEREKESERTKVKDWE